MEFKDLTWYMQKALVQAELAAQQGEVPIGAIVVHNSGEIIGQAYNQVEEKKTQVAHAEMIAIQMATSHLNDWRLEECTLFVTLEPCAMCMGLVILSRVKRVVFAAPSPQFGYHLDNCIALNLYKKKLEIISDICSNEATVLLQDFFRKRRQGYEKRDKRD